MKKLGIPALLHKNQKTYKGIISAVRRYVYGNVEIKRISLHLSYRGRGRCDSGPRCVPLNKQRLKFIPLTFSQEASPFTSRKKNCSRREVERKFSGGVTPMMYRRSFRQFVSVMRSFPAKETTSRGLKTISYGFIHFYKICR